MSAPLTLALDAATYTGTVAVVAGGVVLAERETAMRGEREERLMPAVAAALAAAGVTVRDVERVVCGAGPGSFTSLRIAGSIAKGIATGRPVPLYAVSSLALIVAGSACAAEPGRYLAVLDAMRGESFVAGYEVTSPGDIVEVGGAALVARGELHELARRMGARRIGPAEELAAIPRARGIAHLAAWLDRDGPVELASWEPNYGRAAEAQVKWERTHGRPLPQS
jgi:tRNA threonylcarbamoyl adenosine modification protein YeaZ